MDAPIRFYSSKSEYFEFSNFSPHGFTLAGLHWPTVEHFFQAQKFPHDSRHQEAIRTAAGPMKARTHGQSRDVALRADWDLVKDGVMRTALRAKFEAHPELCALLLSTGVRRLVENSPHDTYWGCGRTGTGRNRLGELLMALREDLAGRLSR